MSLIDDKMMKFLYHDPKPRTSTEICYYVEGSVARAGEYGLATKRLLAAKMIYSKPERRKSSDNIPVRVTVLQLTNHGRHMFENEINRKEEKIRVFDFRKNFD